MNPQLRRQLVLVVVGISAAIVALVAATYLRQGACQDAGGQWVLPTETCSMPPGIAAPSPVRSYVFGAVIGLLAGTMLWRVFTFASRGRK